ncbi:poly-gamma-glutamate synthesis protein (capsule biosynthesis protein) [Rhizobium tibeticum]|uniref:Capsule biosynthesis protein CapA n=1 Tax=Rhizobium tibeticum TaxID=501024 RepID=A0A1H8H206_9HYPH|nr:CapA family protein [Rhizobium tibeticum]SEH63773.1 Capsule biosynthesis protein CapA [Rhizobium tibeticum]SEN50060.1 poly-gamma-glutamate synthesis protein (capsule biosynthesis protein) [Rhizobium tibeticum]
MTHSFTVIATGQSLIHQDFRATADDRLRAIEEIIRSADVSFTNFEMTVFGDHAGWPLKGSYFGYAPPSVLDCLREMGFNALSLANNHAFDLGPSGVLSTIEEASQRGFLHAGTGRDWQSAGAVAMKQIAGRTVGLIAMDAGPGPAFMYAEDPGQGRPSRPGINELRVERRFEVDQHNFEILSTLQRQFGSTDLEHANYAQPNDPPRIHTDREINFYGTVFARSVEQARRIAVDPQSAIAQLGAIRKASADGAFVIAYLHHHHWEPDWQRTPLWVQDFARLCVEAGARMFVSHGAPVLQAIEIHQDAPIFYGLGNFIFHTAHGDEEWSPSEVWKSVIASCVFNESGDLQRIELDPIVIGGLQALRDRNLSRLAYPVLAMEDAAVDILTELKQRCRAFGTELTIEGERGFISNSEGSAERLPSRT